MNKTSHAFTLCICALFLAAAMSDDKKRAMPTEKLSAKYRDAAFISIAILGELPRESFEQDFPPPGWTKITNFGGIGWLKLLEGDNVPGFVQPAPADVPPNGDDAIACASWATGDRDTDFDTGQPTEQFLITPQITNIQLDDSLKFFLRVFSQFGDSLDILISTTVNDVEDSFNVVVDQIGFSGPGKNDWRRYAYALSDFVAQGSDIYIAFREHVFDTKVIGDALLLDLVEVTSLIATSVDRANPIPERFSLSQNFPNPFNPTTNILFSLPQVSKVNLKIHNVLGQQVSSVLDGIHFDAGQHQVQFDASSLPNGIYYFRISAGQFVDTKKMVLIK